MGIISILISLILLAVPIVVVVGVIMLIVRGYTNKNPNGKMSEEDGANMLKNIYTYLVLFATLMMSIGGSVGVFMGVSDFLIPQPYYESYESYLSTYENRNRPDNYNPYAENENVYQEYRVDENEVREQYEIMKEDAESRERRSAIKLVIQSAGWIVIPLPVFLYYQKQMKDKNKNDLSRVDVA
ncbi:MAG TPA: hypothetical protein VFC75_01515 [Erysipelothrix sp.]|nr:hypothetical protein [Erysipelothrix sp.]